MQPELLFNQPKVADPVEERSTPEKIEDILSHMKITKGEDILDVGTGNGLLLPYLCELTGPEGSVTGVDFSPVRLSRAMEKAGSLTPRPTFVFADVEKNEIPGSYDVVILYGIYSHLRHKAATLRRIFANNVKHGGGRIIIAFPGDAAFANTLDSDNIERKDFVPTASELVERLRRAKFDAEVLEESADAYIVEILKA